jgi:hypothetical protein
VSTTHKIGFLPGPVNTLDINGLPLQDFAQSSQLDQPFDRERSFATWYAQIGPTGLQANRAQWPTFTHIQVAARPLPFEQHIQCLAPQRVERMGDNYRVRRQPVCSGFMR